MPRNVMRSPPVLLSFGAISKLTSPGSVRRYLDSVILSVMSRFLLRWLHLDKDRICKSNYCFFSHIGLISKISASPAKMKEAIG
jgi:hypothetical protein